MSAEAFGQQLLTPNGKALQMHLGSYLTTLFDMANAPNAAVLNNTCCVCQPSLDNTKERVIIKFIGCFRKGFYCTCG